MVMARSLIVGDRVKQLYMSVGMVVLWQKFVYSEPSFLALLLVQLLKYAETEGESLRALVLVYMYSTLNNEASCCLCMLHQHVVLVSIIAGIVYCVQDSLE